MEKIMNQVKKEERDQVNGHNSLLVLITGLPAAGKSTLAYAVERRLFEKHINAYVLDGDVIRKSINRDLGFEPKDRSENNRRVGEIAKLFIDAGVVVLAALIAPYEKDRDYIKKIVHPNNYMEVFVNTSLEECEKRDPKGLYKNARLGEISNMTGISAPYEPPLNPAVEISEKQSVEESVEIVLKALTAKLYMDI